MRGLCVGTPHVGSFPTSTQERQPMIDPVYLKALEGDDVRERAALRYLLRELRRCVRLKGRGFDWLTARDLVRVAERKMRGLR